MRRHKQYIDCYSCGKKNTWSSKMGKYLYTHRKRIGWPHYERRELKVCDSCHNEILELVDKIREEHHKENVYRKMEEAAVKARQKLDNTPNISKKERKRLQDKIELFAVQFEGRELEEDLGGDGNVGRRWDFILRGEGIREREE